MYMHTDQATEIHLTRPFQQLHRYKIRQSILLATATLASSFQLATVTTTFSFPWSIAIVVDGDDGVVVVGAGEAADMGRTVATGQTPT
jgi:mRNA degradation ribonuclease J1/J2